MNETWKQYSSSENGVVRMRVSVHLGEPYWRSAGQRELELDVEEGARLANLMALLQVCYPFLGKDLAEMAPSVFIDDEQAGPETQLENGSLVHLIWPVAGG